MTELELRLLEYAQLGGERASNSAQVLTSVKYIYNYSYTNYLNISMLCGSSTVLIAYRALIQ